jgi:hypothetical protein
VTTDLTARMRALQAEPIGPAAQNGQPGPTAYSVTFTDDKTPKLVLPEVPAHDDLGGPGGMADERPAARPEPPGHRGRP